MEYEIHTECPECDGYGIREHQIAVDEFKESDCHECDGSGLVMYTEVYDSEGRLSRKLYQPVEMEPREGRGTWPDDRGSDFRTDVGVQIMR